MKVLLFSFSAFVKFFNLLKKTMFVLEDAKKRKKKETIIFKASANKTNVTC